MAQSQSSRRNSPPQSRPTPPPQASMAAGDPNVGVDADMPAPPPVLEDREKPPAIVPGQVTTVKADRPAEDGTGLFAREYTTYDPNAYMGEDTYDAEGATPPGRIIDLGEEISCSTELRQDGQNYALEDVYRRVFAGNSTRPSYVLLVNSGQPFNPQSFKLF